MITAEEIRDAERERLEQTGGVAAHAFNLGWDAAIEYVRAREVGQKAFAPKPWKASSAFPPSATPTVNIPCGASHPMLPHPGKTDLQNTELGITPEVAEGYRNKVSRHLAKGITSFAVLLCLLSLAPPSCAQAMSRTLQNAWQPTRPGVFASQDTASSDDSKSDYDSKLAWELAGTTAVALLVFSGDHGGGGSGTAAIAGATPVPEASTAEGLAALLILAAFGLFVGGLLKDPAKAIGPKAIGPATKEIR